MLELPESLVTSVAPARDLPPGPIQEEESEQTPPPKEETKPPEPEAEVALPVPEPPKPEPPAEEKQATAPQQAKTPPRSVTRWQSLLAAHIEHFKRYPAEARSRGEHGIAKVAFTIDHEGRLLRSSIVQSSGSTTLDQETLAMLARAQPMPRPPDQLSAAELTFVVPVLFNIR
jgi:protein TonB